MERYSEYKDSGVKWLGQIPSHWEVRHLRNFLTLFSEKGFGNCQLLSVTRENGVILRDKDNKEENHNYVPDDLSGYKHLKAGDFVINKMKSWQGSYGVSDYEGIVSPAYFTCKLRGVIPSFFSRAIRSKAYVGFFMQYSKGIRVDQWDLDPNSMKDIPFVLPKEEEQDAIVAYLETATSKIDAAIAQQQKMIDLLNERKQIIINNAVTKGLDPNVKMKPSGIDWIGDIPEHWEMRKARLCIIINNGSDPKQKGDIPVYGSGAESFRTCGEYKEGPCVLLGRKGATLHIPHYIEGRYWNVDTAFDVKTKNGMSLRYYYYLATCFDYPYYMSQTTLPSMTSFDYNRMKLPTPPENEQVDIVKFLDVKNKKTEELIECHKRLISLLQERKQIIINDVVTGKVKVV